MKRGIRLGGKSFRSHESARTYYCETICSDILSTRSLRKPKNVDGKPRSVSAHNVLKEPKDGRKAGKGNTSPLSPPTPEIKLPLRKFYKLYSKIVVQLETVKAFMDTRRNESDNPVDLRRQLQRADEFSIRFSRNNLYETKRIINEIKQAIAPSPFDGLSPGQTRLQCRKIILGYQAASQALQNYINYAKNPSNLEVPHKINELVLLIADLFLCCEQMPLPLDASLKTEAVKVCNDLIKILKSKMTMCDFMEIKETELSKAKFKKASEAGQKLKKLSMYKSKLTPKLKMEVLRKKHGIACLLGSRTKKSKRDERKAKITHEIYTQKLNHWQGRGHGSKLVKFDAENMEKASENPEEQKSFTRRHRHLTPREVRCQDDDVVTMVQAIADDEPPTCRQSSSPRENDEVGELNQSCIKELLLEAIEGLRNSDKKEPKTTLKKLLNTIENCSKTRTEAPVTERVKVYHVLAKELVEDAKSGEKQEETETKQTPPSPAEQEGSAREASSRERKLKIMFKPLVTKGTEVESKGIGTSGKVMLKLSEETMRNASDYRKAFAEYRRSNIMYKKTLANKPWKLIGKVSDQIILDIVKEISFDFENDAMLRRLYLSELQEVTS